MTTGMCGMATSAVPDGPSAVSGCISSGAECAVRVLLLPGDLLLMHGEARWQWMHGIDPAEADEWHGQTLLRTERVSITLRRLVQTSLSPD